MLNPDCQPGWSRNGLLEDRTFQSRNDPQALTWIPRVMANDAVVSIPVYGLLSDLPGETRSR